MRKIIKHVPNFLTTLRIFLSAVFLWILLTGQGIRGVWLALGIFILASITDFFDGYLARKHELISRYGKIMDPVADKFLTLSAFFIFALMAVFPMWMFVAIAVREIGVTAVRFWAMAQGIVLAAEQGGKIKTVLQMGTIIAILLSRCFFVGLDLTGEVLQQMQIWTIAIQCLMHAVVIVTVWSGISVLWNNRKVFV